MKLILSKNNWISFLFLCSLITISTTAQESILSTRITINAENETVKSILNAISIQANIYFSYSSTLLDDDQLITFKVENKSLKKTLDQLAEQLGVKYKLVENQVVFKKPKKKKSTTSTFTISGYIRDKSTGESLPGATILIKNTYTGTVSNHYGFYSLTLPEGDYLIEYSYIGYIKKMEEINLKSNMEIEMEMVFNISLLGEVTISINEELENLEKSQMSRIKFNPKNLTTLPEFAGEVGLVKSLQTLPGIKTHSDGSAFFFVRGGGKDQNLILIDEAPIYNPAHLFGYYSVIIPDVAKDITIYKADMPINKGDRLSSVIDIQTKDGNMNKFEVNGVLNPLIYRFSVEGPIKKEKSSFFTSFRHSNFWWLYRKEVPNGSFYMYDFNAKLNVIINKKNRLFYSFFYGKDNLMNDGANEFGGIKWSNLATTFRWNHIFNQKLFLNSTVYGSKYNYTLLTHDTQWQSDIANLSFNFDFSWFHTPQSTYTFGLDQSFHFFNPGNLTNAGSNEGIPYVPETQSLKTALFFSNERNISDRFSVKYGLRMPIWTNTGPTTVYLFDTNYQVKDVIHVQKGEAYKTFVNLDPRISLKYMLDSTSSLKFSYGIYHQYIQLLSNSISPFSSFEIWLPSGTNIKPQRAGQFALGYFKFFKKAALEFSLEGYYKLMQNQIDYEPHASLLLNPLIEGELRFGTARSYGIEFLLRRSKGRLSGWISYTWSRVFRQIDGVNSNKEYPAFYDRPHDFSIVLSYHLTTRVNLSANWVYYTGSAITTPIGFYEYNSNTIPLYGEKNNDRLPNYHRLDIAINWRLNKIEQKFQHSLTFAIYNLYNRKNPVSINFNKIETKEGKYVVPANVFGAGDIVTTQRYLLGIMPSITYKFRL
jgi:hypothetical protein